MNKKTPVQAYRMISSLSNKLKVFINHYETPCILINNNIPAYLAIQSRLCCFETFRIIYLILILIYFSKQLIIVFQY